MKTLAVAACLLMAGLGPTRAQSLQGAWSWLSPGQGGADQNTVLFQPDGSYTRVSRLATGQLLRYWGTYATAPAGPAQLRLQSSTQGWLPTAVCAQVPGFPARCSPAPRPPEMAFVVQFTSPNTLLAQGVTMQRDASPALLQAQVPQQSMAVARGPSQPLIQQPVMPALHPYVTPNGPGNQMAEASHATAQRFINERRRGCTTGTDGRLYGCQQ